MAFKRRDVKTGRKVSYADLTRAGIINKEQIAMAENRLKAKRGLKKIKDYREDLNTTLNIQLSRLESGNAIVRWGATGVLGMLGDKRAVPALKIALKDRDAGVRAGAAWALEKIKLKSANRKGRSR